MDNETSRSKFKEADQLFQAARYQEALVILEQLNQIHPNAKNVMYPAAMCLDKLGRSQEALPLCSHLIQTFQDPRAETLKAEIEGRSMGSSLDSMYDMSSLDLDGATGAADILDIPSSTVAHKQVEPEPIPWMMYGLVAAAVVVTLLVVVVPLVGYEAPPPEVAPAGGDEVAVGLSFLVAGFIGFFLSYVTFQVAGVYLALMLMRSLPFEDFWSNAFNLTLTVFFVSVIELSRYGIVFVPFYFSRYYDLGVGGVVFVYIMRLIFGAVGALLGYAIFIGSVVAFFNSFGY